MYLYVTDLEKALTPNRGGRLFWNYVMMNKVVDTFKVIIQF